MMAGNKCLSCDYRAVPVNVTPCKHCHGDRTKPNFVESEAKSLTIQEKIQNFSTCELVKFLETFSFSGNREDLATWLKSTADEFNI